MLTIFSQTCVWPTLFKKKFVYCGANRPPRKHIPEMKKDQDMNRGNIDWRMDRNVLAITKWVNNRAVYFISNIYDSNLLENTSRKQKDETALVIGDSKVNKDHNKPMGCVSKS